MMVREEKIDSPLLAKSKVPVDPAQLIDPAIEQRLMTYGLHSDGGPYEPNQTSFSITLPESVFSSVFLLPLLIDAEQRKETHFLLTLLIPQCLCYIICIVFQASMMWFIYDLVADAELSHCPSTSEKGHWYLRILCLALIVAVVLIDIMETAYMVLWIQSFPDYNPKVHSKIIDYCCENSGRTSIPFQNYKNQEGYSLTKPAAGLSQKVRLFVYIGVILPKLLLALGMLTYGNKYVISAETNSDLMFNAMNALFIFDLDDIIYNVLTPALHKKWVQTSSEISFDDGEISGLYLYQSYFGVAAITAISMAIWTTFCA